MLNIFKEKKILVVDFSWLFVKLYFVNNSVKEHISGTARYINAIASKFDKTYVVLDGENGSISKKELLSSYKEGRSNKEEIYNHLEDTLKKILEQNKVTICKNKNREADEVIAAISVKMQKSNKVTIFSGDKDMLQLAYLPNIQIANSFKKGQIIYVTEEEILNKFEVTRLEDVLKLRVFKGDASDKIKPPIPRLMKKYIDEIISYWDTTSLTESIFNDIIENIKEDKVRDKVIEAKERIFLNHKLMSLSNINEHKEILKEVKQIRFAR